MSALRLHPSPRHALSAWREGFDRPDDVCPYRKDSPSAACWREGREDRLLRDWLNRRQGIAA